MVQKKEIEVLMLVYIGVILIILPSVLYYYIPPIFNELISTAGSMLIIFAMLQFFYNKMSKKVDSTLSRTSSLNEVGIEQVFRFKYEKFEKLLSENKRVRIAISVDRMEPISFFLRDIIKEHREIHFDILVLGECSGAHKNDISRLSGFDNTTIKFLKEAAVNNLIILDHKTCILNYSDLDNSIDHVCVFNEFSEFGKKCKKLFEVLWDDNSAVLYR